MQAPSSRAVLLRRLVIVMAATTMAATTGAGTAQAQRGGDSAPAHRPRLRHCAVKRITDGDTFTCTDRTRVRLLLIDAPERDQKPFGGEARRALMMLVRSGDTVGLESDVQRRDRYGRLLAYAYLKDGRMVNEVMARTGYVVVLSYPPNVRHLERIRDAVRLARAEKRGLWRTSAFECSPRDHRRRRC